MMADKPSVISIIFLYPVYDDQGNNIIENKILNLNYAFDSVSKDLTIDTSDGGQLTLNIEEFEDTEFIDLDSIGCEIASITPAELNDLGAPLACIESCVLSSLIEGTHIIGLIHNSTVTIQYEPIHKVSLKTARGKVIYFPMTGL